MIRNLKVLGLAVAAVLAVSVVGVSAASAAEFHSETAKTKVTGAQTTTHKFKTDPGEVTCKVATFAGEQTTATASTITITPTYKECTLFSAIFGNIAVSVDFATGECDYVFNASGHTEIKCNKAGGNVTVSGPGCTVTIPPQTLATGNTFSTTGAGTSRDIDVVTNASGIKYSYSGFTCGSGTNTTNGTYTGNTTVQGPAGVGIFYA